MWRSCLLRLREYLDIGRDILRALQADTAAQSLARDVHRRAPPGYEVQEQDVVPLDER